MTASEIFKKLGYERNVDIDAIAFTKEFESHYFRIIFDLLEKEIVIDGNFIRTEIENDLLKAIDKQAEELGWLDEKTCTNESECDSIDEFECSNCGIVLSEYQQIEIDEDDGERYYYDYRPKYCPNCGRKIVD